MKTSAPYISVLLPTHNRPEVLQFAIRSVLAQTVPDLEVWVIGDGCTDRTSKMVRGIRDPRVQWLDLPKAPHFGYANINEGLRRARGALIAFMAHDDLWLPDHLERLSGELKRPGIDLAYSRPLWVEPGGLLIPSSFNLKDPGVLDDFLSLRFNAIPAANVVCRVESMRRCGGWNTELPNNGDWDLWARIIEKGRRKKFAYVPVPTCLHFRANWRTDANAGPKELAVWRRRYRTEPGFGAALTLGAAGRGPEQAHVWGLMRRGGQDWVQDIRNAVQGVLDHLVREQDRGALHLMEELAAKDQEIDRLRRAWVRHDPGALLGHDPAIFGPGVHPDEDGQRWLGRQGTLRLGTENGAPATAVLTLACGPAGGYRRFPFAFRVRVNGKRAGKALFTGPDQVLQLTVALQAGVNTVRWESQGWFVPKRLGINDDERELSVRLTGLTLRTDLQNREENRSA